MNQNQSHNSEVFDINNQFPETISIKENFIQKMLIRYKTKEKKDQMKIIGIMMDCALCQGKVVKIILCDKVDYLMFKFFAELLIKIVVYHKNEKLKVESCQFKNGKCYFIKVNAKEEFASNRSISIKEKELFIVREFGFE
jgi:hypothetical protein